MTAMTGPDQGETLADAVSRTRSGVADPRFPGMVDDALRAYGPDLRTHLGRADEGELFTPLDVWTGMAWEPGAAVVVQDRAVLAWGETGRVRTQVIARKRDPGVVTEVDVQPAAITLWIDCDQPINVRVQRFAPGMDVAQALADALRPAGRA